MKMRDGDNPQRGLYGITMRRLILAVAVCCGVMISLRAADETMANALFQSLLASQMARNYDAFLADASTPLKAALTRTQFEASSDILKKRFAGGYEVTPFGELNQKGYQTFLYRLRFKDGGDDILASMSLKADKVEGIYFK